MEKLQEFFLSHVASINSLSLPNASSLIDKCIKKISAQFNLPQSSIYNILYDFSFLSTCLEQKCSSADINDCEKLCHCVLFEGQCKSRYISISPIINADPDKYILTLSLSELEDLVKYASYLYYNYDGGGLTDNSFDALEYHLNKRLKLRGRRYEKIGAEPLEKIRVKLPYPMMSLDKLKPDSNNIITYLQSNPADLVCSDKLDGVSGLLVYQNESISLYTRGNGTIGGDVSYMKEFIKLPILEDLNFIVVRGEFILPKKVWNEKYKGTYSNARSFVSAKINQGYITDSLKDIHFIAYSIIDWEDSTIPNPSKALKLLDALDFETPTYEVMKTPLIFDLITYYKKRRESSEFYIDGLVMSYDIAEPVGNTNPNYTKAFKMTLEEQKRNTSVLNIEWNISRHGRYVPVCIYNAVYIDGNRLKRASAFNAKHVSDWHLGLGTQIVIKRSGDVIPQIEDVKVNENIEAIYPDDKYKWHWSKIDIVLDDIENNPDVHKRRILFFFQTIGTRGIGEGRVDTIYEAGLKTIKDITNAKESDFNGLKRIGKKLAQQLYENIHTSLRTTKLDRYLVALTTFKSKIGRTLIKKLIRVYPTIFGDTEAKIIEVLKQRKVAGIGAKRMKDIAESVPQFMKELYTLNEEDIKYAVKYNEIQMEKLRTGGYNEKIKGGMFVMTGFMGHNNLDLEDYIWDNMGELASVVVENTRAVISATITNITSKMIQAQTFKVPVYSVDEFLKEFNVPMKMEKIDGTRIIIE